MNIQADNIQVSFGAKKILHDISLDIRDKEFVGIIGPNGSGKSTFLKCLYRVLQPNHGKIFFDGTEASSHIVPKSDGTRIKRRNPRYIR